MFDRSQKFTGREYTRTVALLLVAFIFNPILLVASEIGYLSFSLALACSTVCVFFAWVSWKRSSFLSIPTITFK